MEERLPADPGSPVVADYYDSEIKTCLRDYVHGNRRIEAAIRRVVSSISEEVGTLLDVGCGVGLAAAAFRDAAPWVRVHGVDLSPRRVEVARALFGAERLVFDVHDMTTPPSSAPYDLISLIDVYEHIPASRRRQFNDMLGQSLSPRGAMVLTVPSFLHQEYLAKERPESLQIVDETIGFAEVASLAEQTHCSVMLFQMVSIWNSNDYVHAVLARSPHFAPLPRTPLDMARVVARRLARSLTAGTVRTRKKRVFEKTGLRVP